jgi:hypothetical protein
MPNPVIPDAPNSTNNREGATTANGPNSNGSAGQVSAYREESRTRLNASTVKRRGIVGARILMMAPLIPLLAALITVIAYLGGTTIFEIQPDNPVLKPWEPWVNYLAVLAGGTITLICWVVPALVYRRSATVQGANARSYGDLCSRYRQLDARLAAFSLTGVAMNTNTDDVTPTKPSVIAARNEARAHKEYLAEQLGFNGPTQEDISWVSASGYLDLWVHMHRAEEALIEIEPREDVVEDAILDTLRLDGCAISNSQDLAGKVQQATRVLSQSAVQYLNARPATSGAGNDEQMLPAVTPNTTPEQRAEARAVLREVRYVINRFRDDRWGGLVRARSHLSNTVVFTGTVTYVVLALAIIMRVPRDTVLAATTFFLVGAIVGLFNRLRLDSRADSIIEEDYGLARMRLIQTPLFSGLAAIAGVILVAMLPALVNASVLKPEAEPTPTSGTATATTTPVPADTDTATIAEKPAHLADIFDLEKNAFGLIIAATFGLTPTLVTTALQKQVEKLRDDLKSTDAQQSSP